MKKNVMLRIFLFMSVAAALVSHCGGKNSTEPKPEPAPQIEQYPTASSLQANAATVTWVTDIETTTTLRYGLLSGQYLFKDSSAAMVKTHTVKIVNLRSDTTYYCQARSTAAGGSAVSPEFTFKTKLGVLDLAPAAWVKYESGLFVEAIDLFKELKTIQPQSFEACNGLGWCYAENSVDSLQKSLDNFKAAISNMANFQDALAGRGFVYLALKSYASAIEDFNKVLTLNQNYIFKHKKTIDGRDIRLGLAEAYFNGQNFSSAQKEINILAPSNGLKADDPATWAVDGKTFISYAEALLAWIEKIKSVG